MVVELKLYGMVHLWWRSLHSCHFLYDVIMELKAIDVVKCDYDDQHMRLYA